MTKYLNNHKHKTEEKYEFRHQAPQAVHDALEIRLWKINSKFWFQIFDRKKRFRKLDFRFIETNKWLKKLSA